MASIEYITKRLEGKKAEIAKLEKKLERINKAEASGWEDNPYYYSESDKRWTLRDLEDAKKALCDWGEKLAQAEEKAASRNVPAILQFLEMWKARCFDHFEVAIREAAENRKQLVELCAKMDRVAYGTPERQALEAEYEKVSTERYNKLHGYYEEREVEWRGRTRKEKVKVHDGEWEYAEHYILRTYEEGIEKLRKDLDEEANRKYDFIIERTNAITGTITDATALKVGATGELNGYVRGERGTAKIQTIGAGGYNIQCFHFRTLIHKQ